MPPLSASEHSLLLFSSSIFRNLPAKVRRFLVVKASSFTSEEVSTSLLCFLGQICCHYRLRCWFMLKIIQIYAWVGKVTQKWKHFHVFVSLLRLQSDGGKWENISNTRENFRPSHSKWWMLNEVMIIVTFSHLVNFQIFLEFRQNFFWTLCWLVILKFSMEFFSIRISSCLQGDVFFLSGTSTLN